MNWIFLGALCGALSVIAGAFGAHALAARLGPRELQLWETAARYLMYGGFALVLVGLFGAARPAARGSTAPAGACSLGSLIFSGTVFGLALGGPRWLGAVTPIGGTLMIAGFLLFAWAAAAKPDTIPAARPGAGDTEPRRPARPAFPIFRRSQRACPTRFFPSPCRSTSRCGRTLRGRRRSSP